MAGVFWATAHQGCAWSSTLPSRGLGGFDGALLFGSLCDSLLPCISIFLWSHIFLGVPMAYLRVVWYNTIPLRHDQITYDTKVVFLGR